MSKFMQRASDSSEDEDEEQTTKISDKHSDEEQSDEEQSDGEQSDEATFDDNNIIIFGQKKGRRTNTYIINWKIPEDELKTELKNMKKKYGCGGSIKMVNYEGNDIKALQLQGDQITDVQIYLNLMGITNILIKDII